MQHPPWAPSAGIGGCPLHATLVVDTQPSPCPMGVPRSGLTAPMTWPLAGICSPAHGWQVRGVREKPGLWRVQLSRSSKGHTRFSWH